MFSLFYGRFSSDASETSFPTSKPGAYSFSDKSNSDIVD
jgi:hypothetical protein